MPEIADESWNNAPGASRRPNEGDAQLFVRFEMLARQDMEASAKEGRPIFRDVEYIEIAVPGDKTNITQKAVTDELRRRFRAQYNDWKSTGNAEPLNGTPLVEWPAVTRSTVEELAFFKVRTVEQLAGMPDSNLQRLGHGYLVLREKAKDFLAKAREDAPLLRMRAELAERDNRIATMEKQLKQLGDMVQAKHGDALPAPSLAAELLQPARAMSYADAAAAFDAAADAAPPKRRGRPPKSAAAS